MEKKQSSVEWYASASHELIVKKNNGEITECEFLTMHHNLFYDAEAMHKQEIIDAYWFGGQDVPMHINTCKRYYNETYNNENTDTTT